jgi:hypothetical protein
MVGSYFLVASTMNLWVRFELDTFLGKGDTSASWAKLIGISLLDI